MKRIILAAALVVVAMSAHAGAYYPEYAICNRLWIARNAIFAVRGYCFKTDQAARYFGNDGCIYDNINSIPFTPVERSTIDLYLRWAHASRCD